MKTGIPLWISVLSMVLLINVPAMASSAILTMAGIIMNLNHHPSDSEKEDLQKIIEDKATPENVRVLATVLMNMNHKVGDTDKAKLEKIVLGKTTAADVRELADILMSVNHGPTAQEKGRLRRLIQYERK